MAWFPGEPDASHAARQIEEHKMKTPRDDDAISRWIGLIAVLFTIGLFSFFFSIITGLFLAGDASVDPGNVAIIPIKGIVQQYPAELPFSGTSATSYDILDMLEMAESDPLIKAVILDIDSPGGYPVASAEIASKVKSLNKTSVAVIRETGASGAYWIASASDHVISNSMSIVGSIGATASFLTFGGLLHGFNVTYERIVTGEFKDTGTPYRDMTEQERTMMQGMADRLHDMLVTEIAVNRRMPVEKIESLSDGQVFLGIDAYQKGLVDQLGGMEEAVAYVESSLNITAELTEYSVEKSFWEALSALASENSFIMGMGAGKGLASRVAHSSDALMFK